MTAPRRVVPGTTLLITRRCLNRMFLLRPSTLTNQVVGFVLAVMAERYEIAVHAYCVLSNHLHLVLTDVKGNSPAFMRDFCGVLARSLNAMHGRWENFWAPGSYSAVTLVSPADVLDKVAYVLANPAAAGLVQTGARWPGLWSAPERIGGATIHVKRPKHFFRAEGPMPEVARLQLTCPPGFASVEAFREALGAKVAELEREAARKLSDEGRTFLGVAKVLAQRPEARPATGEPRRGLSPRIAARDKWRRIEAIGRLKGFLASYRAAWEAFVRGARRTVFPHGTYWMRVTYGASCAPAG
jgi:REP element-mobilizing transposase RayT